MPINFEQFSDARKKGFLEAKKLKEDGGLLAGTFCTYTPLEVFDAAGMYSVSLCASSDETIADAEKDLPKWLCPLIKSSYGFIVSDKCPYAHFADIIVGETTCDGKKKMYELLSRTKNVHVMQLPQSNNRTEDLDCWTQEIHSLIELLEQQFGVSITDEKLRAAVKWRNELRRREMALMEMQQTVPPAMEMRDLFEVLNSINFSFDHPESMRKLSELQDEVTSCYMHGDHPVATDRARILITGCPTGGVVDKTIGAIEKNGGVVVCMENCNGIKGAQNLIDEDADDIVRAIAARYLKIPCSVMSPNSGRIESIRRLCKDYKVDAIVDITLLGCHTYGVETALISQTAEEMGVPYLALETDYSHTDDGMLLTRLSALIEMVRN